MLVVGLTGGIGAGKTTVANLFAERGVPIVDTDLIAKQVTEKGQPALTDIVKHFGQSILLPDGSLNRSQLRDIIFHDAKQRHWLENKLHPLIKASMEAQIKTLKAPYCIAVIPLLFEVEFYSMINRILVVDAPEALQVERVIARDHLSKDQIKAILHNQANREDRVARAHDVIINDGDLQHLTLEVDALHQAYLKLSNK